MVPGKHYHRGMMTLPELLESLELLGLIHLLVFEIGLLKVCVMSSAKSIH